jgi:predicted nuclease of restriction endonuclease-like (RecB) superfamily
MARQKKKTAIITGLEPYGVLLTDISDLLDHARRTSARSVNSILTATYWEIGRRIVEFEQGGKARAEYGEGLWKRLATDLTARYGRGFSKSNLASMRGFYLGWEIFQTPSGKLEARVRCPRVQGTPDEVIFQTLSGKSQLMTVASRLPDIPPATFTGLFPLSWSHYVRLMSVTTARARAFYEAEAIRGGWSVRQLDRQISTQFFERTSHSKRQAAMLAKGQKPLPEDAVSVQDEIRDPYLLEFLDLKDEYSESELEDALIRHLEWFLLELGAGFTFIARQKRIRVGDEWYRIDLLLYHRGLRCLVVIDLKTGAFTHADAGQMNLYLNYAKRHLMLPDEADPVGIILCSKKDDAVVEYATGGIRANVFASKYLTNLPDKETLRQEILKTQRALIARSAKVDHDQA